jgi:hypothetical protein
MFPQHPKKADSVVYANLLQGDLSLPNSSAFLFQSFEQKPSVKVLTLDIATNDNPRQKSLSPNSSSALFNVIPCDLYMLIAYANRKWYRLREKF